MVGTNLFEAVIDHTDVDSKFAHQELQPIMQNAGFNADELSVEQLREVVATYLQQVFLEMMEADEDKSA